MASFPTDWDVHHTNDFPTYGCDETLDVPLGMNLLMHLGNDNRSTGCYRISLFGGTAIEASYQLEDITPDLPPQFRSIQARSSFKAANIILATNSCSSPWRDLDVLLQERTMLLYDDSDEQVDPTPLITYLQDQKAAKTTVGASIRFGVAVGPDRRMRLEIQSLPGQAKALNAKANLRTDNAVSVLLGHYPLNADMFSGNNPGGVVPIFFARDPAQALTALSSSPDTYRYDIGLINSQFLYREHLTLTEAATYLTNRARAAKGTTAFPNMTGPPAKKSRPNDSTATGNNQTNTRNILFRIQQIFTI